MLPSRLGQDDSPGRYKQLSASRLFKWYINFRLRECARPEISNGIILCTIAKPDDDDDDESTENYQGGDDEHSADGDAVNNTPRTDGGSANGQGAVVRSETTDDNGPSSFRFSHIYRDTVLDAFKSTKQDADDFDPNAVVLCLEPTRKTGCLVPLRAQFLTALERRYQNRAGPGLQDESQPGMLTQPSMQTQADLAPI